MTATEQREYSPEELEAMERPELVAIAEARGIMTTRKRKQTLIFDITRQQERWQPAERSGGAIDGTTDAPAPGEPEDLIARLRVYLADPNAASQEEADELQAWMMGAPRERYAQVVAEVRGFPAAASTDDARESDEAAQKEPRAGAEPATEAEGAASTDDVAGAEIERWQEPPGGRASLLPSESTWAQIQLIAQDLHRAMALPAALRNKPADIALLLLTGRDVGVAPTVALNKIYVIDGKPSMAPELMRALIVDRGHFLRIQTTPTSATARYRRKEWPEGEIGEVTFTLADAKRAKLIQGFSEDGTVQPMDKKEVWAKYPRAMLSARVTSEVGRLDFADVLAGISYTPEELDAEVDGSGAPMRVESTTTIERKQESAPPDAEAKDAEAREAGWENYGAEREAHRELLEKIRTLNEEQKAQAQAMREEHGWPMRPKLQFDGFAQWVQRCVMANSQEQKQPAPGADASVSSAAREALSEAEGRVGKGVASAGDGRPQETVPAPDLNEPGPDLFACGSCGQTAASEAEIEHLIDCEA